MIVSYGLTEELVNTQYAPVAALSAYYQAKKVLEPLEAVTIGMKTVEFSPPQKLIQVLISLLTGCEYLSVVNTRLGPERVLAQVWSNERFAHQSTLSEVLDALSLENLSQLEVAVGEICQKCGRTWRHDWRGYLWLDFDLSGLPCGKQAEGSKKGYFSGRKNTTGRQLARVSAINYHETLWSDLFPGNQHTVSCLQPAVLAVETALALDMDQHRRTVFRIDGGAGSDNNIRWLVARGYQVVGKGFSGRRAHALGQQVRRWDPYGDAWLGTAPMPVDFDRPTYLIVKKWPHDGTWKHSYHVTTINFPSKVAFMDSYNLRGGAEVEQFREDKGGLSLSTRRKRTFQAQKTLILLTDLAHNLLADFRFRGLAQSPFTQWGLKRIVRDLLNMPGLLTFEDGQLKSIDLLSTHPYANALLPCLKKYCTNSFGD